MNKNEIIEIVLSESGSIKGAIDALEDGEALAALGLTDNDQEAVEEAHAELKRRGGKTNVSGFFI